MDVVALHLNIFREFAKDAANMPVRIPPLPSEDTFLSGLEPLTINKQVNFVNIGELERMWPVPSRFARLIREGKFEQAIAVARDQVEGGAQIIDINMDDAMLDAVVCMVRFLNLLAVEPGLPDYL